VVIALDTNIIVGIRRIDAVQMAAVTAIAAERQLQLYLPEVVLDEAVATRRREAASALGDLESALDRLRTMGSPLNLSMPDPAEIANHWRTELSSRFNIDPLPDEVARESLLREIERTPPTRDGRGARDAAVWLIVKRRHAQGHGPTYFVSENVRDFGNPDRPNELHPLLAAEVTGGDQPFVFARSLSVLLDLLAVRLDIAVDVEVLDSSARTRESVIAFAERSQILLSAISSHEGAAASATYFAGPVQTTPTAVRAVHGYEVGGTHLAIAWTDWRFRFEAGSLRRFPMGALAEDIVPVVAEGSLQLWLRFDGDGLSIAEAQITAVSGVRITSSEELPAP
jgi:hypothetical protein